MNIQRDGCSNTRTIGDIPQGDVFEMKGTLYIRGTQDGHSTWCIELLDGTRHFLASRFQVLWYPHARLVI